MHKALAKHKAFDSIKMRMGLELNTARVIKNNMKLKFRLPDH